MIIDSHTHIFWPEVRDGREAFLARAATFRELYSRPKARIATAEELLVSMDAAGIDRSVACGFAWSDAELCQGLRLTVGDPPPRSPHRAVRGAAYRIPGFRPASDTNFGRRSRKRVSAFSPLAHVHGLAHAPGRRPEKERCQRGAA